MMTPAPSLCRPLLISPVLANLLLGGPCWELRWPMSPPCQHACGTWLLATESPWELWLWLWLWPLAASLALWLLGLAEHFLTGHEELLLHSSVLYPIKTF